MKAIQADRGRPIAERGTSTCRREPTARRKDGGEDRQAVHDVQPTDAMPTMRAIVELAMYVPTTTRR